jgi:hypothetical protein
MPGSEAGVIDVGAPELHLPRFPSGDEIANICSAAHALGYVIIAARRHTDQDDATMVCLDWYGGPPRGRVTEQGADMNRASRPR